MAVVSCMHCGTASPVTAKVLSYCSRCIREGNRSINDHLHQVHLTAREEDDMPSGVSQNQQGLSCLVCSRGCRLAPGEKGYCGLKENREGRLVHLAGTPSRGLLEYYFDPLPTNCVADWVCPARKGLFARTKNLAVFYGACTLNCLFCQNWQYRTLTQRLSPLISAEGLAAKVDDQTACICFFGGDPAPQIPHALRTVHKALAGKPDLKICWETSGNISDRFFQKVMEISYRSGGTIKFDFKAFNRHLYFALTGGGNEQMLKNFTKSASFSYKKGVTLAVASTLLVPGYVTEEEVHDIAAFIARHNPWTPYSLLGFYPHFRMKDLPFTSRKEAEACYSAAKKAGLYHVHLANEHLLK